MKHKQLEKIRKQHHLLLSDVAFLLNINVGHLSKIESGKQTPGLHILMGYHVLFETEFRQTSIDNLHDYKQQMIKRGRELHQELLRQRLTRRRMYRVKSLHTLINRLDTENHVK